LIVRREHRQAARHHGGNTAGHREAAIVRFGWHQQRKGVIAVDGVLVQAARFIAGNRQVVALRHELICQLNGRDAFRAVAGAGEGDQQQRMRGLK
jgi:hypothetical protein